MQNASALLNQFLGQPDSSTPPPANQPQQGGGMNLKSFVTGPGGLATGALAGGVAGLLLGGKKPKKLAASALKIGGGALVGGLAYKAWNDWQANKAPVPTGEVQVEAPPAGTAFLPSSGTEQEDLSRSLIRAMIAAAKVDGHVSIEEQNRIFEQLDPLGIGTEHQVFIEEELAKPLDIEAIVSSVTSPEQASEIYAASLLIIDPDGTAERGYLAMLAARLKLEPGLIDHLHANAGAKVERMAA